MYFESACEYFANDTRHQCSLTLLTFLFWDTNTSDDTGRLEIDEMLVTLRKYVRYSVTVVTGKIQQLVQKLQKDLRHSEQVKRNRMAQAVTQTKTFRSECLYCICLESLGANNTASFRTSPNIMFSWLNPALL